MESDLEQFVSQIIPWDSAALLLQKGAVVPISKYNQEAKRHFPRGVAFKYAAKILENIRDTSAAVGLDMIENNIPEKNGVLNRFVSIVEMFEEELDEMGWSFLALAACLNGNMQRAQAVITNACARIELQTDISVEIKRQRIGSLRKLLKELTELQSRS
jgi:hypothetical protein